MERLRAVLANANALTVFEAAARHGNFTRAAEELGISQPAVTRHIKAVEASVGRPLFLRRGNRPTLTAEGLDLFQSVSSGFGRVAETLERLRRAGERPSLRIGVHAGLAQLWLMPHFADLCARLDPHDVHLTVSDDDRDLSRGDFDFDIRVRDGGVPGREARLLMDETVCPIATPDFLARHPHLASAAPKDLAGAPLLHMDAGDRPWLTWRGWFLLATGAAPALARPQVLYRNYPLVLQQALAGRGIALGWRLLTDAALAAGDLVRLGPEVRTPGIGYRLTWPDRAPSRDLAEGLAAWFRTRMADAAADRR